MLPVQLLRLLFEHSPLVLEALLALVVDVSLKNVSLALEFVYNLVPYLFYYPPLLRQQPMLLMPHCLLNKK